MRIGGIRDVTYRTTDLAAAVAWWRDELGLVVVDEAPDRVLLEAPDERQVVLSTSAAEEVTVTWASDEDRRLADPDGHTVLTAAPPPGETAEDIERRLTDFISKAGTDAVSVADTVATLIAGVADELPLVLDGVAHNTVLAAQLLLSQRARQVPQGSSEQWQLQAASTLLSGPVIGDAGRDV